MSVPLMMMVAAMALGAAGHYLADEAMTRWGFALAVCAGLVWLARAAWERRGSSGDMAGQSFDEGGGSSPHAASHDAPSGGDCPHIGGDS